MLIRNATPDDAFAIARVHVDSWRTTYAGLLPDSVIAAQTVERREAGWRRATEAALADAARGFVLVADGGDSGIIGFANAGPEREAGAGFDSELYAIYLLAEHQGRGVGRKLFNRTVEMLRTHGHRSMRVWVLEGNPAEGFYARLGGERVGQKSMNMAGYTANEIAYGWPDLHGRIG